jgi:hypothetical protein
MVMSKINIINSNFISIKSENTRKFFFEELSFFFTNYRFCHLIISHRDYERDFNVNDYNVIKINSEESFIVKFDFKNNYSHLIDQIDNLYNEFQYFTLIFNNDKEIDFEIEINTDNYLSNKVVFFKSIEKNVIWVKGNNITQIIKNIDIE